MAATEGQSQGSYLEVVVSPGFTVRVGVGWRDEPGHAGLDLDVPVFLVDQVVMMTAEQRAVADCLLV